MNTQVEGKDHDAHQLSSVVAWIRQRLERCIDAAGGDIDLRAGAAEGPAAHGERGRQRRATAATPQHAVSLAVADGPSPLATLCERFRLSPFEGDMLMLCAAMEFDTRIAPLCGRLNNDTARSFPTYAIAFAMFDEPSWDAISPERPLRRWCLVEIGPSGTQPLTASPIRADERIVNYLKGLNHIDDRLVRLVTPLDSGVDSSAPPHSQQKVADAIVQHWGHAEDKLPIVHLVGSDPVSKRLVAQHAAATTGRTLLRMPVESLPAMTADVDGLARLWRRESLLLPLALYLDGDELDNVDAPAQTAVRRFIDRAEGHIFVATREGATRFGKESVAFEVRRPTVAEQSDAWTAVLGAGYAGHVQRLTGQFELNLPTIAQLAARELANEKSTSKERAKKGAPSNPSSDHLGRRLWDACRAALRPRLDSLAHSVTPRAGWDDIVLPHQQLILLRQIADQVAHRSLVHDTWGFAARTSRGLGITALFSGESGTGKTMAAEIIAGELCLDLYRIDLSAVVSKYIGETERNLRRLFDAAEDAGAILFFDEADALFGKRSEVKDSHDRYANIEINYLLQRMESYRGIAILATNAKTSLDNAFMRRLRFVVNFPYPGRFDRKLIWQRAFPAPVRRGELDFEQLARLNLTGGNIQTTALNAAFLAAADGKPVTMEHVLAAARTELIKLNRPINEAELRLQESPGAAA